MRRASISPAAAHAFTRIARRASGQTRLPCFGPTGWEVVLRFARPAPQVPSWLAS